MTDMNDHNNYAAVIAEFKDIVKTIIEYSDRIAEGDPEWGENGQEYAIIAEIQYRKGSH
jgi:hypothetical protein